MPTMSGIARPAFLFTIGWTPAFAGVTNFERLPLVSRRQLCRKRNEVAVSFPRQQPASCQPDQPAPADNEQSHHAGDKCRPGTQKTHGIPALVSKRQRDFPSCADLSCLLALRGNSCQQIPATLHHFKHLPIHGGYTAVPYPWPTRPD